MSDRRITRAVAMVLAGAWAIVGASSCSKKDQANSPGGSLPVIATAGGVTMVAIPGGTFQMGSRGQEDSDEPAHEVALSPFYMDACEVTQGHFEKLLGRNPSRWKDPNCPVEQIRWKDAAEYCNARSKTEGLAPCYDPSTWQCDFAADGYRLPTEAEWEYACRAGGGAAFCCGDDPARLGTFAWYKDNCTRSSQPAGSRRPNVWGLYDMHGNVWEWCNDYYGEDYYRHSPPKDPRGPNAGSARVLRGGCWDSRADKCRSAYRSCEDPGYSDACFGRDTRGMIGFRCVRRLPSGAGQAE